MTKRYLTYEAIEEAWASAKKERDMLLGYCEQLRAKNAELEATNAALSIVTLDEPGADFEDTLP